MFDVKIYLDDFSRTISCEGTQNFIGNIMAAMLEGEIKSVDKITIDDIEIPRFKDEITLDLNRYNPSKAMSKNFIKILNITKEQDLEIFMTRNLSYKCVIDQDNVATFYAFDYKSQNYREILKVRLLGKKEDVSLYIAYKLINLAKDYGDSPNVRKIHINPITETNILENITTVIDLSINMIKKYGKYNFMPLYFTSIKFYYNLFDELNVYDFYQGATNFLLRMF